MTLLMAGILYLLYRVRPEKALFWAVLSCVIQMMTEAAAVGLLFCIRRVNYETLFALNGLHITAALFACIIEMIFIMLVLVIWKFRVRGMRRRNILLLVTIPVYQLALLGCMFYMCSDFSQEVMGAVLCFWWRRFRRISWLWRPASFMCAGTGMKWDFSWERFCFFSAGP